MSDSSSPRKFRAFTTDGLRIAIFLAGEAVEISEIDVIDTGSHPVSAPEIPAEP
jgi:hypothetical protein